MIPKFTNPHLRVQSTQIVSRHDLHADGIEGKDEPVQDGANALATLETLVKRSLGEFQLQQGPEEDTKRKRKRRRVDVASEEGVRDEGVLGEPHFDLCRAHELQRFSS